MKTVQAAYILQEPSEETVYTLLTGLLPFLQSKVRPEICDSMKRASCCWHVTRHDCSASIYVSWRIPELERVCMAAASKSCLPVGAMHTFCAFSLSTLFNGRMSGRLSHRPRECLRACHRVPRPRNNAGLSHFIHALLWRIGGCVFLLIARENLL